MHFEEEDTVREPEMISAPCFLMETDDNMFDQFFGSISLEPPASMSMEQPPQQPAIDSMPTLSAPLILDQIPPCSSPTEDLSRLVIKQEKSSGFLDTYFQHNQQPSEESLSMTSVDEQKRMMSSLVKEELSCRLQLKMLQEGKELSFEAEPSPRDYPVSEETLQLQRVRREKNREAAKKCRQKKKLTEKQQEQKLREAEREVQQLRRQLDQERQNYATMLNQFETFPCFMAYLKKNKDVLKTPFLKSALQAYTKCQQQGGRATNSRPCTCGCSVEQSV